MSKFDIMFPRRFMKRMRRVICPECEKRLVKEMKG